MVRVADFIFMQRVPIIGFAVAVALHVTVPDGFAIVGDNQVEHETALAAAIKAAAQTTTCFIAMANLVVKLKRFLRARQQAPP